MCAVDGVYEEWRKIVVSKPQMRWKFVQPNTFVKDKNVEVKVYEESNEGIIQSWVERDVWIRTVVRERGIVYASSVIWTTCQPS